MSKTTLTLHSRFPVGPVDPRLFGGFLEHMGRAVYEGVFDPAGQAQVCLPPLSFTALTFTLQ